MSTDCYSTEGLTARMSGDGLCSWSVYCWLSVLRKLSTVIVHHA